MDPALGYRHILCPMDFSETSRRACLVALGYCEKFDAKLTLFHVRDDDEEIRFADALPPGVKLMAHEEALMARVNELVGTGALPVSVGENVRLAFAGGEPHEEILRFTQLHDVDLIIMGTHGRTGFRRLFMGSQAEKVVQRAPCHVLSVKPDDYELDMDLD